MSIKKNLYVDVTNFLDTKLNTGIQRVLKEFLYHAIEDNEIELKILYFNQEKNEYVIIPKKQHKLVLDTTKKISIDFNNSLDIFNEKKEKKYFFDLDRVWNSKPNRNDLYKKLKESNFYIINYIYDMIPILYPSYFYNETKKNFPLYINALLRYSNHVFFDSESCQKDFLEHKKKQNNTRDIKNSVIHLGCDFRIDSKKIIQEQYKKLFEKKYILFVGTIEPRKKHKELLEVFELLHKKHPDLNLIFIGKFGWDMEELKNTIKNHILLNKVFFHLENIEDETLVRFYENAFIVCYLSKYEGFGLPVAESLFFDNITITSKNSSLKEISNTVLFENSKEELYNLLDNFLKDDELYEKKKLFIKKTKNLITWNNFYTAFRKELIKV